MAIRYALPTLLCLLVAAPALTAQRFERDMTVGDGPASAQQIAPKAAVGPDGTIYVIWADYRGGIDPQVFLSKSTDGGETFGPGRQITNATALQAGMQRGPQLVVDRMGVLHMTCQVRNDQQKISVRYMRSTDGGATFSTPLAIAADSGKYNQDFPSVAVDSSGNPFAAWIDSRESEMGTAEHPALYVARSTDGGRSFNAPVNASTTLGKFAGTCECCNTALAVSPEGNVFATFRSNIDNNRDIFIARSLDGGTTFTTIKAASESWQINACPMTGSSVALDGAGTLHIVWRDSRPSSGGKDYVYYTTLLSGASTCAPDRKLSRTTSKSNYPSVAVAPDGGVICAFQDNRNDAADIFFVTSTDGGATFSRDAKLTHETGTTRQEFPAVAVGTDGTPFVVWQDSRLGQPRIMIGHGTTAAASAPIEAAAEFELGPVRPHPAAAGTASWVDVTLPATGTARLTIHDALGNVVATPFVGMLERGEQRLAIGTVGLCPGAYFCTLRFGNAARTRPIVVR